VGLSGGRETGSAKKVGLFVFGFSIKSLQVAQYKSDNILFDYQPVAYLGARGAWNTKHIFYLIYQPQKVVKWTKLTAGPPNEKVVAKFRRQKAKKPFI